MFRSKEFTKREIFLGYLTIGIILLAIWYNFIYEPIFRKYNLVNQKIKILEIKLSKYQILIQNQEKISRLYKEYPLISYLDNTAEKRTTIILKEIEKLVKANNLILVNIKPQDIRLIAECIIEMKIEGQVKNILQFIYKLENFLYPLRIKELVLAPSNMKEDNLECNLIIQEKPI